MRKGCCFVAGIKICVCLSLYSSLTNIGYALMPEQLQGVSKNVDKNRDVKIIATLGKEGWLNVPSFCKHGANIFRINGSHIKNEKMLVEILQKTTNAIKYNAECDNADIMYDTQGPEIRTRIMIDEKNKTALKGQISYNIAENDVVIIHTNLADKDVLFKGDVKRHKNKPKEIHIGVNYEEFLNDVKIGSEITIENRDIYAKVVSIDAERQIVKLKITSINTDNHKYNLTDRRHINLLGRQVNQPTFTDNDKKYIRIAYSFGVKYYALSFVRDENDIKDFYKIIKSSNDEKCSDCKNIQKQNDINDVAIIAKIETRQGLDNLDNIVKYSSGAMVARGDLSSEIPMEEVPYVKEKIITTCRKYNKLSILATNVLESYMRQNNPSVNDVDTIATALQLGVGGLMLSNETAQGNRGITAIDEFRKQIKYYRQYK